MPKYLKVVFPEKCIGCELCVAETQRQLNNIGFEGALIRIFKEQKEGGEGLVFSIQIDPRVNELDLEKIKEICPTKVFSIEEQDENDGLFS
jgi:ferredoxin